MIMANDVESSGSGDTNNDESLAKAVTAAALLIQVRQGQRFLLAAFGELEQVLAAWKEKECLADGVGVVRLCALAQLEMSWALGSFNEIGASLHETAKGKHE